MASLSELEEQVLVAPYIEVEPQFRRGSVIVIDPSLAIAEVGLAVASDDKVKIEAWLQGSYLSKASALDWERWKTSKQFLKLLIIQPFVLVQEYVQLNQPPLN